jgi:hypothetical protein
VFVNIDMWTAYFRGGSDITATNRRLWNFGSGCLKSMGSLYYGSLFVVRVDGYNHFEGM